MNNTNGQPDPPAATYPAFASLAPFHPFLLPPSPDRGRFQVRKCAFRSCGGSRILEHSEPATARFSFSQEHGGVKTIPYPASEIMYPFCTLNTARPACSIVTLNVIFIIP